MNAWPGWLPTTPRPGGEAEALGLAGELAAFPREDSATADALTYCDMTTSPTGQRITLDDRLAEIAERYGAEHLVVRWLQRAHDHLAGAVHRTEERLRVARVRVVAHDFSNARPISPDETLGTRY
jgi:hypothetical protein